MENKEKAINFFNYFYKSLKEEDKGNVCLRIRGTKEKPEVKVYYKGIKLFDFYHDTLILNVALFLPNNTNANDLMELARNNQIEEIKVYERVKKDYEELEELGFKLEYANNNVDLPFSTGAPTNKEEKEKREKKGREIQALLNKIIQTDEFKEYFPTRKSEEENKIAKGYRLTIKNNKVIDLKTAFQLKLFGYAQTGYQQNENETRTNTGFRSLKVNFSLKEKIPSKKDDHTFPSDEKIYFDYSDASFESLLNIMKRRAEIYAGLAEDYADDFSKTRSDSEKSFQQTLVSKMSTRLGRQQMANIPSSPFSENDIPFEMEFTFYASNKSMKKESEEEIAEENNQDETLPENTRDKGNKKGRIDNIFVDFENKKVKFVELKIDDGVIGGTNGIHKHLLDMANGLRKNINFKEEFAEIVKNRYEILKYYGITNEYDIDFSKQFDSDFTISYVIICGYSEEENESAVKDRFNSIKDLIILDRKVVTATSDENKKFINVSSFIDGLKKIDENNPSNQYIQELLYFTIDNYEKYLKEQCNCPVDIYVTDNEYSKYEKIDN